MNDDYGIDTIAGTPNWFKLLIATAMLSGVGSTGVFLTKDTGDRYYASQAAADLALRDERISRMQKDFDIFRATFKAHADGQGRELQSVHDSIRTLEDYVLLQDKQ